MSEGQLNSQAQDRLAERRDNVKIDAAAGLVSLLLKGGNVFLEAQGLNGKIAFDWEQTQQRLTIIGAENEAELRKLQACLDGAKEKTERLAMVLDFAAKSPGLPPAIAEGIGKAVDNLTREL